jgi:hypothetical protein
VEVEGYDAKIPAVLVMLKKHFIGACVHEHQHV